MTTLQRGICLGCVLVAAAAAVVAGVFLAPDSEGTASAEQAQAAPAAHQTSSAPTPAPAKPAAPAQAQPQPEAQPQAQAQPQDHAEHQAQPTPGAAGRPPVQIQPRIFDFGVKNPNKLVWTKFKIHNPTKQTLFVREVKPACKCTVPTLDSKVIPPGGEITLDASVDLRGHLGDVRKNFNVFFEGYAQPIEGVIQGVMSYPVQVSPSSPRFLTFPNDRVGQLTLRSIENRPFRVCAINGKAPKVLFKNSPDDEATEWRVQYEIDAPTPADLPYMLLVETNHPGARMLDVKLVGQPVSGRELQWIKLWKQIFVNRSNVNLGVIPKGQSADFETSVMRPDHSTHCTVSFESTMFNVPTTPLAAKPGDLSAEVVKVAPIDGRPEEEMYTVRVTNHSDENKVIQMPLYFRSGNVEARTWIGARLIPSPGDDPCAGSTN